MSDAAQFWSWFLANQERLYQLLGSKLTDELYDQLIKYDSRLGVEVCTDEPVRDVIITALGNSAAFDSVRQLVRAAPSLDRWTFVALRPGKGFTFTTTFDGNKLDVSTLMFDSMKSSSKPAELGVKVHVPGALEVNEKYENAVRRVISTGLGEERASILKHIEVVPGFGGGLPIKDLGSFIKWWIRRNS